ncbi:MAG: carboxypeptidase-like regulatory domain-containing protein [Pirellulaceae bacterium]
MTLSGISVDLRLWVTLDGYVPLHAMWAKKFHSDGDQIPDQFTFTMQSGTEIGGMVVDEAGAPIAGAIVEVQEPAVGGLAFGVGRDQLGIRPVRNHYLAEGETALITDVNGRWTLRNVPSDSQLDAGVVATAARPEVGFTSDTSRPGEGRARLRSLAARARYLPRFLPATNRLGLSSLLKIKISSREFLYNVARRPRRGTSTPTRSVELLNTDAERRATLDKFHNSGSITMDDCLVWSFRQKRQMSI